MAEDAGRAVEGAERTCLRELWRRTRLLVPMGNGWQAFVPGAGEKVLVVTAWNPDGRAAAAEANAAADTRLFTEIAHFSPLRVRGDGDGWHEDGWALAHVADRSLALIRRYRQLAGWVVTAEGRGLLWRDGVFEARV